MKKLVVILCMLGALFGEGEKDLITLGWDLLGKKDYKRFEDIFVPKCMEYDGASCLMITLLGETYNDEKK